MPKSFFPWNIINIGDCVQMRTTTCNTTNIKNLCSLKRGLVTLFRISENYLLWRCWVSDNVDKHGDAQQKKSIVLHVICTQNEFMKPSHICLHSLNFAIWLLLFFGGVLFQGLYRHIQKWINTFYIWIQYLFLGHHQCDLYKGEVVCTWVNKQRNAFKFCKFKLLLSWSQELISCHFRCMFKLGIRKEIVHLI